MSRTLIEVDIRDHVHTVTFDSQHNRNALSNRLIQETHEALDDAEASARVIVFKARGPSFCSGADLKERQAGEHVPQPSLYERLLACPVPVIAVVNGRVRAGGIVLVAVTDIAIGTPAADFAVPEVRRGVIPAVLSAVCASQLQLRAMQRYFLTGDTFSAEEAVRVGLLTEVVSAARLEQTLGDRIASVCQGGPRALAATKDLLTNIGHDGWQRRLPLMTERSRAAFQSAEAREGIAAFVERRTPSWAPEATKTN